MYLKKNITIMHTYGVHKYIKCTFYSRDGCDECMMLLVQVLQHP